MRIGFDAKRAFNNRSGLGNYSRSTIRLLSEQQPGNDYFLFTPEIDPEIEFSLLNNMNLVTNPLPFKRYSGAIWRTLALVNTLKRNGVELFHGLSNELPGGIHKSGIKSVVTIHDLIFMRKPELYHPIDRFIYTRKVKYACRIAGRIIATSTQTRNDLVELLKIDPARIDVVYQGCDPAFSQTISPEYLEEVKKQYGLPEAFILTVGTIEPRKNLKGILMAMKYARVEVPLVVVGQKTLYYEELLEYIEEENPGRILFYENMDIETLAAFYKLSGLFLYPSFYEGFGIPILEALSAGIPVITSKGGCFEETGGPASYYVNPEKPEEIAEAIRQVLDDDNLRHKMISEGLAHANLFRESEIAKNLFKIYHSL
jgi:glycosyltransferase involved in cell wall biosynthesis